MTGTSPIRIVVLISGSGSNLQSLIDAAGTSTLQAEIVGVVSNRPNAYGLVRAEEAGIASSCIDHKQFDSREVFDTELRDVVAAYQPDLVILAGFMRILTPVFVAPFAGKLLNIHPSLLPNYPGLDTHQRALDAGDSHAGATVHFVTEELDGGPPIIQATVAIEPSDNAETLASRVLQYEHRIYVTAAQWFAQGRLRLQGNQALLDGETLPESGAQFEDTRFDNSRSPAAKSH